MIRVLLSMHDRTTTTAGVGDNKVEKVRRARKDDKVGIDDALRKDVF